FVMDRVRPPGLPPVPRVSTFPETNLRTYVRGPDGGDGLWFLSLEVANPALMAGALLALGVPYLLAEMSVQIGRDRIPYCSARRRDPAVCHRIEIRTGEAMAP